jgi:HEAT repeat protein
MRGIVTSMIRLKPWCVLFLLTSTVLLAQGNLTEFFTILRTEGNPSTEAARKRNFEMLDPYLRRDKSFDGEWQTINDALTDPNPFIRDQSCAVLAVAMFVKPAQPIRVPDATRELVIQRFGEALPNLRENAVRVIALMEGGVPPAIVPELLQMARTEPNYAVRSVIIGALASVKSPPNEVTEFWVQSLSRTTDTALRGEILSAFRGNSPTDPRIISLVIDALKDKDYFVRQEAIASVVKIGKPAAAALPSLMEIRDSNPGTTDEMEKAMKENAASAIQILSRP